MFQLVERWGRRSLLLLDMHLGMRARSGFHLHLNSFLRMPWKNPKFCTQGEILALGLFHQTGIWNKSVCGADEIKLYPKISFLSSVRFYFSLDPQFVLVGHYGSRDIIATKARFLLVKKRRILWRAISDLKKIIVFSTCRWSLYYIKAEKLQENDSTRGSRYGVNAAGIWGVVVRVGWWWYVSICICEFFATGTWTVSDLYYWVFESFEYNSAQE